LRNFLKKYGYFVFPTAVLLVILVVKNADGISTASGYYLMHYLYNYTHGFMTRGFVGEVISMFTDTVTPNIIRAVQFSFSVLLMISASVCFGVALKKTRSDSRIYAVTVIAVFFLLLHPMSFIMYFDSFMTDKLLIALTLIAVLLAGRKYFRWLVPVLCLLCTLVSIYYSMHSMILIAIVLLQEHYESRYRAKNLLLCLLSYGAIIGVSLYGMLVMHNHSFSGPEEMYTYFIGRFSGDAIEDAAWFLDTIMFEYFQPLYTGVTYAVETFLEARLWQMVFDTVLIYLPMFAVCGYFWYKSIKIADNKFQKFIFFLCLISPVLTIVPTILALEYYRHFTINILMQVSIFVYYLAKKNDAVVSAVMRMYDYFSANRLPFYLSAAYLMIAVGTI